MEVLAWHKRSIALRLKLPTTHYGKCQQTPSKMGLNVNVMLKKTMNRGQGHAGTATPPRSSPWTVPLRCSQTNSPVFREKRAF